jgi:hypothetical protein
VFDIPINQDAHETGINSRLKTIRFTTSRLSTASSASASDEQRGYYARPKNQRLSFLQSTTHECLKAQWIVNELIRLGTSPTGIKATIFKVAVSIAEIDAAPEFET